MRTPILLDLLCWFFWGCNNSQETERQEEAHPAYRGTWYSNQPDTTEYHYKYSGGLDTYPQQHVPIAIHSKEKYTRMAEHATAYFATYVTSYDFPFPEQSPMGKINAKATGSVWANVQNRHGAPAICNFSGDALLKLYRITNKPIYLELLKDIAHNAMQYVSTEEKLLVPHFKPGYVCERVNISSWKRKNGDDRVGANLYDSSPWVEVAIMQTYAHVPGIYYDVEKSSLTVFDHFDVSVEASDNEKLTLSVKNPTQYNAIGTLFIDKGKEEPMGWNNYAEFEKIELKSGEEKVVSFSLKK